jgi:hypothetical protein
MANKKMWMAMLAIALVFGMTVVGCNNDSSEDGDKDPIKVNMSLPNIKDVESFTGTFVDSANDAQDLIQDALDALTEFQMSGEEDSRLNIRSAPRSMSRKTYTEPYDEIIDYTEGGVTAKGFITGYEKMSAKNDNNPGGSVGDYQEISARAKMAVTFNDVQQDSLTYNGKYTYDESIFLQAKVTSLNPDKGSIVFKFNAANGYALSVSKGGKGLKFVMKLNAAHKVDRKNISVNDYEDPFDDLIDENNFDTFKLTIDVYDNNNVKKNEFSKTFNNFDDANDYLDLNIGLL